MGWRDSWHRDLEGYDMPKHRDGGDTEGPYGTYPDQPGGASDLEQFRKQSHAFGALAFLQTVAANLDNHKLNDEAFREFMRNSMDGMDGVDYTKPRPRGFIA